MEQIYNLIDNFFYPAAIINQRGDILYSNQKLSTFLDSQLDNKNINNFTRKPLKIEKGLHYIDFNNNSSAYLLLSPIQNKNFFLILYLDYSDLLHQICDALDEYIWAEDHNNNELYANKKLLESPLKTQIKANITNISQKNGSLILKYKKNPLFDKENQAIGTITSAYDITKYHSLKKKLQLISTILDTISVGVIIINLDGSFVYVNDYVLRNFNITKKELEGKSIFDFIDPYLHSILKERYQQNITTPMQIKITIKGVSYWVHTTGKNITLDSKRVRIVTLIDISHFKKQEEKLNFFIQFDPLTYLYNRHYTITLLEKKLKQLQHYAILYLIDIDHFKEFNEAYSHDLADMLLTQIADRLREYCSHKGIIGRMGGDEFLIFFETKEQEYNLAKQKAKKIAKILQKKLTKPYHIDGLTVKTTMTISITVIDKKYDIDTILKQIESTLFHAKKRHDNTILLFDQKYFGSIQERLFIREELKKAIKNREFKIAYQAQVKLIDEKPQIIGYEALLRWIKDGKVIPPNKFIPIAEESGLIIDIGLLVIEEACKVLEKKEGFTISVNISSKQFEAKDFVSKSLDIINRHNFDNRRLIFEITESMLLTDLKDAMKKIEQITKNNIHFSIDDFGTGYSSFEYLKKLPLSELKIDKSFVDNILTSTTDQVITKAIIDIAHLFDMQVVAEGVETKEQVDMLKEFGADIFQGYYFAKPTFDI